MNLIQLTELTEKLCGGSAVMREEALDLCDSRLTELWDLMLCANRIRQKFFGKKIKFCSIINAKSGLCSEDCGFCAQSAHNKTAVKNYPLVSSDRIIREGRKAYKSGAHGFSIVASGKGIGGNNDVKNIAGAVAALKQTGSYMCASLGEISVEDARTLKKSGLKRYHHNLETAETYFSHICSTHSYTDKIKAITSAKEAGLEICSGGIFGLGESWAQRIELAFRLSELKVNSIPINFLNPIAGTPFEDTPLLSPMEALRIIAVYRFIFPDKDITICGGREKVLRHMQSYMFFAGANGTMLGNYLTTKGRSAEEDLAMIHDLGLVPH